MTRPTGVPLALLVVAACGGGGPTGDGRDGAAGAWVADAHADADRERDALADGSLDARGPAPTTCASGRFWDQGDTGSALMHPGRPCRACHLQRAPELAVFFTGTVFPGPHEADGCLSPPPAGTRVEILDRDGRVRLQLSPNAAGNFQSAGLSPPFPLPYRARLVSPGRVVEMRTEQRDGDCNACHTEQGTQGAEGRLWARDSP